MSHPFTRAGKLTPQFGWYKSINKYQLVLLLTVCLFAEQGFTQTTTTFPPASNCTSKDLTLVGASLPGTNLCNTCTAGDSVYRNLNLRIYNKTGSTRTSFAFWGTLVIRNSNGTLSSTRSISGCNGPVASNDTTTLVFDKVGYVCGQSLVIKDLFLAWTDASPKSTCPTLNSATINPKCGTLDSIQINTGLNGSFSVTNATCAVPGAIDLTPMGGKPPYTYAWVASNGGAIPSGQSTQQDLTGLVAGTYTVTITDALNCTSTRFTTVTAAAPVTAAAGDDFTITCSANVGGKQIGEGSTTGFTYSWSPAAGLSSASISNPTANPSATTTYTVTKTNTASGCSNTDQVIVTVNNTAVVAVAGDDFTKTCTAFTSGKQIGEPSVSGFTYSWSPATGLSDANASNPTANPTTTTTYTVTKTNTASGCNNTDQVIVTVNNAPVVAAAGDDFTKTCISNASGKQIGEPSTTGFTYSWSPTTGLSNANISDPTANPTTTTTYTVTKTNTASGCSNTDQVIVTVDNAVVTASAGDDFTKSCVSNTSGKQIGEAAVSGFTYSWSPATGLSNANISNPTANPSSTTTYTVTKTNTASGCSNTDQILVTVNTDAPPAPTVCVVQPSLCGPTTGSVTIKSPLGADYQYSIDNGTTWQANPVFSNLQAGSVTGIKVKKLSSGCISSGVSCDASDCSQSGARLITNTTTPDATLTKSETTVKAFPNPFSNVVKFQVNTPEGGKGTLEVYNLQGQRIKTVFQGRMLPGANNFQIDLPLLKSAQLFYVLRVGDKSVTGKLLQLNQ